MGFFKRVLFALISSLTLNIRNAYNLPPKGEGPAGRSHDPSCCMIRSVTSPYLSADRSGVGVSSRAYGICGLV